MTETIMKFGDYEVPIKVIDFEMDVSKDSAPIAMLTNGSVEGTATITIDTSYYKIMAIARMMEKHSPKKAKQLRRRFEYLNPLRIFGIM